ncbi:MAG: acylphosphatase [Kiritimatiellia bacterium]
MTKRGHFVVSGRVQGVCYRMYTQKEAHRLGVTGYVKNRGDGTVEVVAEGDEESLRQLLKWCRKGPAFAMVRNVEEEYSEATEEYDSFIIAY